jgi:hypothetical protein
MERCFDGRFGMYSHNTPFAPGAVAQRRSESSFNNKVIFPCTLKFVGGIYKNAQKVPPTRRVRQSPLMLAESILPSSDDLTCEEECSAVAN